MQMFPVFEIMEKSDTFKKKTAHSDEWGFH
jgi:hypothetical protein